MNPLMISQMGLSLVGQWGQFQSASIQADLQERIQQYRNTMSELSAARATNAVTINEVRTVDAKTEADFMIQKQAISDQSDDRVAAAAAGVTGNSVEMAARDLRASAGNASFAAKRQAEQQLREMGEQRTSIAINRINNKDIQVIPKPSVGSMLLGMGVGLLDIYDSHQPEGSKLLDYNGGRVNDKGML